MMSKFRFISDRRFCAREILLPTAIAGLLGWCIRDWFTATLIGIGVLFIALIRVAYMESLSRDAIFNGVFWSVNLNNRRICWVPESWLAGAKLKTLRDPRLYADQILEFGKCSLRIINVLLCLIPVLVFWLAVVLGIVSPEIMQSACAAYLKASPAEIAHSVVVLAEIMAVVAAGGIGLAVISGANFGLVNCFGLALERDLRSQYGIFAGGRISVCREPEHPQAMQSKSYGPSGLWRRRALVLAGIVMACMVLFFSLALKKYSEEDRGSQAQIVSGAFIKD
jgi:hypothetical protein